MSSQQHSSLNASLTQIPKPKGVYPLNGDESSNNASISLSGSVHTPTSSISGSKEYVYPDFKVWHHTAKDDTIMRNYVQKGYYEAPVVPNESLSGRQIVSHLLVRPSSGNGSNGGGSNNTPPSTNNNSNNNIKLQSLSDIMIKSIYKRREINKVKVKSTYKPPPRVTLTDHKKEMWMKNLADFNIPLRQLARAIPHGIRNKVLLEHITNYRVPIARALWLIRCVSTNEQRQLKRKTQTSNSTAAATSNNSAQALANANNALKMWIVEWTDQICLFIESTIESCFNKSANADWRVRLDYVVELTGHLYMEELLSREAILAWVIKYLGDLSKNDKLSSINDFRQISIHLIFVKLFWFKIIQIDYFSKELGEYMLIATSKLYELKNTKGVANVPLITSLYNQFQFLIRYLFYYNVDSFIIPNNWSSLKGQLKLTIDDGNPLVLEQFKLISYRNESLMIDEISWNKNIDPSNAAISYFNKSSRIIYRLDNLIKNPNLKKLVKLIFDDLDDYDDEFSHLNVNDSWKRNLSLILKWSITNYRDLKDDKYNISSNSRLFLVSSILKIKINSINTNLKNKKLKQLKLEIERQVLDFIYQISEDLFNKGNGKNNSINLKDFLVLINELHSLNLFQTSSYLRRLIASGVIYLQDAKQSCYIHMLILSSMPKLPDSNSKIILKRLINTISGSQVDATKSEEMLNETKEKLHEFISSFSVKSRAQPQSVTSYFDVNDFFPENFNPLEIGKIYEIAEWLLSSIQSLFQKPDTFICLRNIQSITTLYKLFDEKLNRLPQFLHCLVKNLDQVPSNKVLINEQVLKLILNMVSLNDELLTSSIVDDKLIESNSFTDILTIFKSWKTIDKFNLSDKLLNQMSFRREFLIDTPLARSDEDSDNMDVLITHNNNGNGKNANNSVIQMTGQELSQLGIQSVERLLNAAEYLHHLNQSITQYYNALKGFQSGCDIQLVLKFLKNLKLIKRDEFEKVLINHLKEFVLPTLTFDYNISMKLILKLVLEDLITLEKIIQLLRNVTNFMNNDSFNSNSSEAMLNDIMFNLESYYDVIELDDYEILLIAYIKKNYMNSSYADYFKLFSNCLKKNFLLKASHNSHNHHHHHHHDPSGGNGNVNSQSVHHHRTHQQNTSILSDVDVVIDMPSIDDVVAKTPVDTTDNNINPGEGHGSVDNSTLVGSSSGTGIVSRNGNSQSNSDDDMDDNDTTEAKTSNIIMGMNDSINSSNDDLLFKELHTSSTSNYGIFKKNMINCFWDILKSNTTDGNKLIEEICGDTENYDCKSFFSSMLLLRDNGDYSIGEIIETLGYYCLPISQIAFKLIMEENFNGRNEENEYELNVNLNKYMIELLNQVTIRFNRKVDKSDVTYLIGSLFELINNDLKISIINCFEGIFLNSEKFPTVVINDFNITFIITSIISSCSRLKDFEDLSEIKLTDSLVFSLNSSLEKLNYYCGNVEQKLKVSKVKKTELKRLLKDIELSIILLSRIILIHKNFLVDLILKRSVNLQTDPFLINLTKLFNNKFMDSNFKLKNLLYDIIISIKLLLSESLGKNGGAATGNNVISSNNQITNNSGGAMMMGTPAPNANLSISSLNVYGNRGTPTSSNFLSPMNSPMVSGPGNNFSNNATSGMGNGGGNNNNNTNRRNENVSSVSNIMNISPPNYNNNLRHLLKEYNKVFKDGLKTNDNSIKFDSNKETYYYFDTKSNSYSKFNFKKFEMIGDSNPNVGINDSCISLQYFDSCIEKVNPK